MCVGESAIDWQSIGMLGLSDWKLTLCGSISALPNLVWPEDCRVVIIVIDKLTENLCSQIKHLICTNRQREWVALVDPESLCDQICATLISSYFFDHLTLPLNHLELVHTLEHAKSRAQLHDLVMAPCDKSHGETIIGTSAAIRTLMRQVRKVASTNAPVLIGGESGSGKELIAQEVHCRSERHHHPFVAVNCGAIASALVQSELFGSSKGSFTGSLRDKKGFLAAADKGTIFLDEIGDLPLDMQTNLLRFLQEGTITPVGSTASERLNVRVIAATNINLQDAVKQGHFRSDLFYRLNVLPLIVPPLRERRDDIVMLAEYFFAKHSSDAHPRLRGFSSASCRVMTSYDWPGNIRELINRVRMALVMADGRFVMPIDLGFTDQPQCTDVQALGRVRIDAERAAICEALCRARNNVTRAAKALGVSRMTLYRLIERHHLDLSCRSEIFH